MQRLTSTTIYVYVTEDADFISAVLQFNQETGNKNVGKITFDEFLAKEVSFSANNATEN